MFTNSIDSDHNTIITVQYTIPHDMIHKKEYCTEKLGNHMIIASTLLFQQLVDNKLLYIL